MHLPLQPVPALRRLWLLLQAQQQRPELHPVKLDRSRCPVIATSHQQLAVVFSSAMLMMDVDQQQNLSDAVLATMTVIPMTS